MKMGKSMRVAYGEALRDLGAVNDKIVVLDADLAGATQTCIFRDAYPDRFYDFGIAEANMMCEAAGFAHSGYIPFASTFAIFGAGRAFEMVRNAICYPKLNVKLALSHSGVCVGEDGGSHQSVEDISLMRSVPNMTVIVPCDEIEMRKAVFAAVDVDGPVYLRVARTASEIVTEENTPFVPGKVITLKEGSDVALFACGLMVPRALQAAKLLEEEGISAAVVNFHTIKPIDEEAILAWNSRVKAIVTAEEHSIIGGLGSAVAEVLAGNPGARFGRIGINDVFGISGKPEDLFRYFGLTAENIADKAKALYSH